MNNSGGHGGIFAGIGVVIACIAGLILSHSFAPGLFKVLLWIGIGIIVVIVAIVVLVIIFSTRSGKKDFDSKKSINLGSKLDADQLEIVNTGRKKLLEVRMLNSKIKNQEIKQKVAGVCSTCEKILTTLKQKPEEVMPSRQFLNYYIPTLNDVLTKYQGLEASGVPLEDMPQKISSYLSDVQKAMDKQYQNLFESDKLDMTVDMEAMTINIKKDGLIDDR